MNTKDQIIKKHFTELGRQGGRKFVEKYGKDKMAELSRKGVEARQLNARRRKMVTDLDNPANNCKVCGASHAFIDDYNRATYAKVHKKYIERQVKS